MSRARYSIPKGPPPQQQMLLHWKKPNIGKKSRHVHGGYRSMSHGYLYKGLLTSDGLRTLQTLSSCRPVNRSWTHFPHRDDSL